MDQNTNAQSSPTEEILRGEISRVTFRNPTNGYSVLQLSVPEKKDLLTVVGTCLDIQVGTNVVVRGTFISHQKFGKQFQARSIVEIPPDSTEGIEKFLGSGVFKGIRKQTAKKLVAAFGTETLNVLLESPEKVAALRGFSRKKAVEIAESLRAQSETREAMRFLIERNLTPNLSMKIIDKYKAKTVEIVSKDPYILARDIRGVGFATADTIAMNLGFKPDSPERLRAGLHYALEHAMDDGHCYLPKTSLIQEASKLLKIPYEHEEHGSELDKYIKELIEEGYITNRNDSYFLSFLDRAEQFVATFVAKRCVEEGAPWLTPKAFEGALANAEKALSVKFSDEQRDAVRRATTQKLLIITGGPGCGKTTVIRAIVALYKNANKHVLLAAPTGRAAQRMAQVCDLPAKTIHRLLRYDPTIGEFSHGPQNPLRADIIIIDEASMVDIVLAKDLFSAIPPESTLILVGDKDQLPSVGPGRVFGDLVSLPEVQTAKLSRLFRRGEESSINFIAHQINSGVMPQIPVPDGETKSDAYFIPREFDDTGALVEALISDQIPKKFGIPTQDITVLTPTNRGPLGTIALNTRLQDRLNPKDTKDADEILIVGEIEFRVGDRVCQRVNNYNIHDDGVFNGDLGYIYEVNKKTRSLIVELWDGRLINYQGANLNQLALAYAVTVHRAQGSEVPCVVLVLHDSHFVLLERQLIYTGVTRAKQLLIVVGSKRALGIAAKRTSSTTRFTMLKERVEAGL